MLWFSCWADDFVKEKGLIKFTRRALGVCVVFYCSSHMPFLVARDFVENPVDVALSLETQNHRRIMQTMYILSAKAQKYMKVLFSVFYGVFWIIFLHLISVCTLEGYSFAWVGVINYVYLVSYVDLSNCKKKVLLKTFLLDTFTCERKREMKQ